MLSSERLRCLNINVNSDILGAFYSVAWAPPSLLLWIFHCSTSSTFQQLLSYTFFFIYKHMYFFLCYYRQLSACCIWLATSKMADCMPSSIYLVFCTNVQGSWKWFPFPWLRLHIAMIFLNKKLEKIWNLCHVKYRFSWLYNGRRSCL